MKPFTFLAAALLTLSASVSFGQTPDAPLLAKNTSFTAGTGTVPSSDEETMLVAYSGNPADSPVSVGQEKAKGKRGKAGRPEKEETDSQGNTTSTTARETQEEGREKGQVIKEVATARRQGKPEKVGAGAALKGSAARPQSSARPIRGAATGAVKAAGNAAKAGKPVKVGGVGVGIKVGKN